MTATSALAEVIASHCDINHASPCEGVAAAIVVALKVDGEASAELERLHGIALEHAGCGRVRADLDAANLRLNAFASDLDAVKVTAAEASLTALVDAAVLARRASREARRTAVEASVVLFVGGPMDGKRGPLPDHGDILVISEGVRYLLDHDRVTARFIDPTRLVDPPAPVT